MSIRLNKVLTELNIGLQTAVDFLKNKKQLGDISDDASLSTKISDEQYNALVREFKGDKDIKDEAEKIFAKKTKEKKQDKKSIHTKGEDLLEKRQQFKPVGKIDLNNLGKKTTIETSAAPNNEPAPVTAAEKQEEEVIVPADNNTVATQAKEEKAEVAPQPVISEQIAETAPEPEVEVAPKTTSVAPKAEESDKAKAELVNPVTDKEAEKTENEDLSDANPASDKAEDNDVVDNSDAETANSDADSDKKVFPRKIRMER